MVNVPVLPEMTAKVVYGIVQNDPKIRRYLPDPKEKAGDGKETTESKINR
jgi:hypothetical protein